MISSGRPPSLGNFSGPPRFRPVTPWTGYGAVLATAAVVLIAIGVAGGLGTLMFAALQRLAPRGGSPAGYLSQSYAMAAMVVMQAVIIGLVWRVSGWHGADRRALLSLARPLDWRTFGIGLAGMALLLIPYNLAIFTLWPKDFTQDLRPFADLARSPAAWLAGLVVAVGAPLSEELLFRGFLLPALALTAPATLVAIALIALIVQMLVPFLLPIVVPVAVQPFPAGPLVFGLNLALLLVSAIVVGARYALPSLFGATSPTALSSAPPTTTPSDSPTGSPTVEPVTFALAALFTTSAWTLMHIGYSVVGLLEVSMIGLYFCWLIWRTGNLWLTIALHAFYNGAQFLVLAAYPLPTPI